MLLNSRYELATQLARFKFNRGPNHWLTKKIFHTEDEESGVKTITA